jgi:DNA-binding response OmpR family regulator
VEDHGSVRDHLGCIGYEVHTALTYIEACTVLQRNAIGVVVCEACLSDGDWRNVLDYLWHPKAHPDLIVASRLADDRLWVEVLDSGGCDVLAKPFDAEELRRVVGLALRASPRAEERRVGGGATGQSA